LLRITLLGLPQNIARDASTTIPKSLTLRARSLNIHIAVCCSSDFLFLSETRKTYRAVLSEPRIVIPSTDGETLQQHDIQDPQKGPEALDHDPTLSNQQPSYDAPVDEPPPDGFGTKTKGQSKKRPRGNDDVEVPSILTVSGGSVKKKKKRAGNRESEQT
jgi:ribonuclease P/MRP protein subunit RPP1